MKATTQKYSRITVEHLRKLFTYNPETGDLISNGIGKSKKGKVYNTWNVGVYPYTFEVHIVCFAIYHGRWPVDAVDHKDRNDKNNRIDNLREATNFQNAQNQVHLNGELGVPGVTKSKSRIRPYLAQIYHEGKKRYIGIYATIEEAAEAYRQKKLELHGEFAPEIFKSV